MQVWSLVAMGGLDPWEFTGYDVCFAVPFRNRERITFDHLVSMKKPGETAILSVLRDGIEQEFSISLRPVSSVTSILCSSNVLAALHRM